MPWGIKIVNFSEKFKREASYEPELHPGVTYKLRTPKATLKIFSTGSITVTGVYREITHKYIQIRFSSAIHSLCDWFLFFFVVFVAGSVADVQSAIEHIYPLVHEFRKYRAPAETAPKVASFDPDDEEAANGIVGQDGKRNTSKAPAKAVHKAVKRKYPFGMAENDPDEDLMGISDVESDADDVNNGF